MLRAVGRKGRFPSCPLAGPCLEHQCSETDPIPCPPGFSASPLAAAEPRLTESTLLAAVISINAALLALAITCQWLAAHFQLEISCQHLQLMSRSGEQTWRTFSSSLVRILDVPRTGCPLCQRQLHAWDRHPGLGQGPAGHRRAQGECISPWLMAPRNKVTLAREGWQGSWHRHGFCGCVPCSW